MANSGIIGKITGDLSGSVFSPTVIKIRNVAVSNAIPQNNQSLVFHSASNSYVPSQILTSSFAVTSSYAQNISQPYDQTLNSADNVSFVSVTSSFKGNLFGTASSLADFSKQDYVTTSSFNNFSSSISINNSSISSFLTSSINNYVYLNSVDNVVYSTSSAITWLNTNRDKRVLVSGTYGGVYVYNAASGLTRSADFPVSTSNVNKAIYSRGQETLYLCTTSSVGAAPELVVTSSTAPSGSTYEDVSINGNVFGVYQYRSRAGGGGTVDVYVESWVAMFSSPSDQNFIDYMRFYNLPYPTIAAKIYISYPQNNVANLIVFNITAGGNAGVTFYSGEFPYNSAIATTVTWENNGFYYLGNIPTDILTASFVQLATSSFANSEGNAAKATGFNSRALGNYTLASENYSVAEGSFTTASGLFSHAGGIGTIASGSGQTVAGNYNLQNNTSSLFIVGNGTNSDSRSDILNVNSTGINIYGTLSASAYQGIPYDLFGANSGSIVSGTNLFTYVSPRSFKIINLLKYTGNGSVDLQIRKNGISSSIPIQVSRNDLIEVYATTTGSRYYYTLEGIV